jgi:predicted anti-sigma-YlaC factor YlaD
MKCEDAMFAVMAMIDGEPMENTSERAMAHLAECENCRLEAEQIRQIAALFATQRQREQTADLWDSIAARLPAQTERAASQPARWQPFLWAIGSLVLGKLMELLPKHDWGGWFKLLPLLIVLALFSWLKENPFQINTELTWEGEQ